jgi:PKD repeat protein
MWKRLLVLVEAEKGRIGGGLFGLLSNPLVLAAIVATAIAVPVAVHDSGDTLVEPTPEFSASPTSGTAPLDVQFTDESTGDVLGWGWDFDNDGTVDSTEQNPSHTYTTPGTYTVVLTAIGDLLDHIATKTDYITVSVPEEPTPEFSASPTSGTAPLDIQFTDESTGDVLGWGWDFDNDGTVDSTEQNPSFEYASPGTYTVSLTVAGPGGSYTETKTDYITVSVLEEPLTIAPDEVTMSPCGGQQLFTASGGTPPYAFGLTTDGGTVPAAIELTDNEDGTALLHINECEFGSDSNATVTNTSVAAEDISVAVNTYLSETSVPTETVTDSSASVDVQCAAGALTLRVTDSAEGEAEVAIAYGSWARAYGGAGGEEASCIQQTADGGSIVAGWTTSYGAGNADLWVLKLDRAGLVEWQKAYGTSAINKAHCVQQTFDQGGSPSGYIVAGSSVQVYHAGIWIFKLDNAGAVEWQRVYKGSSFYPHSIHGTPDGGYVVSATMFVDASRGKEAVVLKLDSSGAIEWQKTYGVAGSSYDEAKDLAPTLDGGYILAGLTAGYELPDQYESVMVLKLDGDGEVDWQKSYGPADCHGRPSSVRQTSDGGYIIAGEIECGGGGEEVEAGREAWVLKLDSSGGIEWQKTYGGAGRETASSVQQTDDGGYVVAGRTSSFGDEYSDAWVMGLSSAGEIDWQKTYGSTDDTESASSVRQTEDGGYIVAGYTWSFGAGNGDAWVLKLNSDGSVCCWP